MKKHGRNTALIFLIAILMTGAALGVEMVPATESAFMDSYKRGLVNLKDIDPGAHERIATSTNNTPSPLEKHFIGFLYGDIYESVNLSPKVREIVLVAGLTAMGNAKSELKTHITGALNSGWTIIEVQEIILQMSIYSGFPSSANGMNALKEVLGGREKKGVADTKGTLINAKARVKKSQREAGVIQLEKLQVINAKELLEAYKDVSPSFAKHVIEYAFGDILSRPEVDYQTREMATIAALTATGATKQLKFHVQGAMNIGASKKDIADIIVLVGAYSGFPSMANATSVLKEIVDGQK